MDKEAVKDALGDAIKSIDLKKLKPGFTSSEFVLLGCTVVATFLTSAFGVPVDPTTLLGLYTLVGGYIAKRWNLKSAELKK